MGDLSARSKLTETELLDHLTALGFVRRPTGKFERDINGYGLSVTLDSGVPARSTIDWGPDIVVHHGATSSFNQRETLVVLECVIYLLEKGYKPGLIELERTWRLGHSGSGRLDILLRLPDSTVFAMIECKTWGLSLIHI